MIAERIEKKIKLIFGKRGSGKSYLTKKLIENERRLVIHDTLWEYSNGVVFENYMEFLKFWLHVYRGNYRLIYRPTDPAAEIDRLAQMVFLAGDLTFVVEEIDCFCTAHNISEQFAHVIQRGRHQNITLIGVTQRPYGIHRLLTSQAKEIYVFNTNEVRDRDYLKSLLGQDIEGKLNQLGIDRWEFVKWQDGIEGLEIGRA